VFALTIDDFLERNHKGVKTFQIVLKAQKTNTRNVKLNQSEFMAA
jgi:hypothetical protein